METLASSLDITDPKAKNSIAAQVMPLIRDIPSPIERDTYRQQLARLLRVDERTLNFAPIERRQVARRRSTSPRPENRKAEKARGLAQGGYALEAHALGVLMRRPDMLLQGRPQAARAGAQPAICRRFSARRPPVNPALTPAVRRSRYG